MKTWHRYEPVSEFAPIDDADRHLCATCGEPKDHDSHGVPCRKDHRCIFAEGHDGRCAMALSGGDVQGSPAPSSWHTPAPSPLTSSAPKGSGAEPLLGVERTRDQHGGKSWTQQHKEAQR